MRSIATTLNEQGEQIVLVALLTGILVVVGLQIVLRTLFSTFIPGAEEFVKFAFVILSWVGAAYAVRKRVHLRMTLVQERLPPVGQISVLVLSNVLFIVLMVVVGYYGIQIVQVQREFGRAILGLPDVKIYWFYMTQPFVVGLVIFRVAQNLREDIELYRSEKAFARGEALFNTE